MHEFPSSKIDNDDKCHLNLSAFDRVMFWGILTIGAATMKYHFTWGLLRNSSTFMPKMPARKVRGRKMKVIQLSRHRLVFNSRDWRASRIPTDLYICAAYS